MPDGLLEMREKDQTSDADCPFMRLVSSALGALQPRNQAANLDSARHRTQAIGCALIAAMALKRTSLSNSTP